MDAGDHDTCIICEHGGTFNVQLFDDDVNVASELVRRLNELERLRAKMNKLIEASTATRDAESLIRGLWHELEKTRNMLGRMIIKHGHFAQDGQYEESELTDFVFGNTISTLGVEIVMYKNGETFKRLADEYKRLVEANK